MSFTLFQIVHRPLSDVRWTRLHELQTQCTHTRTETIQSNAINFQLHSNDNLSSSVVSHLSHTRFCVAVPMCRARRRLNTHRLSRWWQTKFSDIFSSSLSLFVIFFPLKIWIIHNSEVYVRFIAIEWISRWTADTVAYGVRLRLQTMCRFKLCWIKEQ